MSFLCSIVPMLNAAEAVAAGVVRYEGRLCAVAFAAPPRARAAERAVAVAGSWMKHRLDPFRAAIPHRHPFAFTTVQRATNRD